MEIKKNKKSFIQFEWKKLFFPIILIILFGYQILTFYSVSNVMENDLCDINDLLQKIAISREQNDTEQANQAILELEPKGYDYLKNLEKSMGSETIFDISSTINPFFPYPCELSQKNNCRYYIDKETFDCMYPTDFYSDSSGLDTLFESSTPEYKKASISLLIFHLAIIFIMGYLISAIIIFIFRNIKTKISSNPSAQLYSNYTI